MDSQESLYAGIVINAGMVELVDSGDLGSPAKSVRVRVPLPAPYVGVAQMDSSATAF